jgi:hypothetical protein
MAIYVAELHEKVRIFPHNFSENFNLHLPLHGSPGFAGRRTLITGAKHGGQDQNLTNSVDRDI